MRLRPEVALSILRAAHGPSVTPHEIAGQIAHVLRRSGVDEMKIAEGLGKFWGTYFKRMEERAAR